MTAAGCNRLNYWRQYSGGGGGGNGGGGGGTATKVARRRRQWRGGVFEVRGVVLFLAVLFFRVGEGEQRAGPFYPAEKVYLRRSQYKYHSQDNLTKPQNIPPE